MKTSITIALTLAAFWLNSFVSGAEGLKSARSRPAKQPFTYANVVSFFKSAELRITEVQPRCTIFFEGEWKNPRVYDYCTIMVENSDQDIQVTFYLTDAHEMNWVTEFLDSPLFRRDETEKLFGLVNSNQEVRGRNVGRFRVDFHHWQPRHAEIIVFGFTPLRGKSSS
jgi:hypothetical protein